MKLLIPCYSNIPDREYDCVVLDIDDDLLEALSGRSQAFNMDQLGNFPELYRHEYHGGPLFTIKLEDGEYVDSPGVVEELEPYLKKLELEKYELTPATGVYLSVVEGGKFYFTFDGRQEKHAPAEVYETEAFTVDDLSDD